MFLTIPSTPPHLRRKDEKEIVSKHPGLRNLPKNLLEGCRNRLRIRFWSKSEWQSDDETMIEPHYSRYRKTRLGFQRGENLSHLDLTLLGVIGVGCHNRQASLWNCWGSGTEENHTILIFNSGFVFSCNLRGITFKERVLFYSSGPI